MKYYSENTRFDLFINNVVGEYLIAMPIGHVDDVNYLYIVISFY